MERNSGFKRMYSRRDKFKAAKGKMQAVESINQYVDTKVYVEGLPNKITWWHLKTFFTKFGDVTYARVFFDHITKKTKSHGYVQFSTHKSAHKALKAHPEELIFHGSTLKVHMVAFKRTDVPNVDQSLSCQSVRKTSKVNEKSSVMLNDHCLIHIFMFLTPINRIAVERVCKQWQKCVRGAMRRNKYMKILKQKDRDFADSQLSYILRRTDWCLVSLDISDVSKYLNDEAMSSIALFCPKLKRLNMTGAKASNVGMEELTKKCTNLQWLSVLVCRCISEDGLLITFKNCQNLEYLDCRDNDDFTGQCLKFAGKHFKALVASGCTSLLNESIEWLIENRPHMETLLVSRCSHLTYKTLALIVKFMPHLKEIGFGSLFYHIYLMPNQHVVHLFGGPRIITKLELFDNDMTDIDLLVVCENCPLLVDLDISFNTKLTDFSVSRLADLEHLEYLSVCRLSAITDASLIGVAMRGKLRVLHVQFNSGITDDLMKVVAERCANIQEVDVALTRQITLRTLFAFYRRSLKQANGSKVVLYTKYNRIDEKQVSKFRELNKLQRIQQFRSLYPLTLHLTTNLGKYVIMARVMRKL